MSDARDVRLACKRKQCPVESIVVRLVTFEETFHVVGSAVYRCPHCGGRLREAELFPLSGEETEDLLRSLKGGPPWIPAPRS